MSQVFTRACAFVFLYTSMDKADLRRVMKLRSCVVQARKEPLGFPCLFPDAPSFIVSVSAVPTEIDTFGEDLAKKFQATFCILLHSGLCFDFLPNLTLDSETKHALCEPFCFASRLTFPHFLPTRYREFRRDREQNHSL